MPALELLVRKRDGLGYVVRELDASDVLRGLRPRPLPATLHRTEEGWVLRRGDGACHLLLSEPEAFLWERIDGNTTQEELATAWFVRFGSFDFDRLVAFLQVARRAGFIEMVRGGFLRHRVLPAWATWEWRWNDVDPVVRRLHRWVAPFLRRSALLPAVLVVMAGAFSLSQADVSLPPLAPISFAGFWLLHALPHEAAHAVATVAAGRRVRAVGVGWRGVFVDTTDMYLSDRRARAVVAMAGPVVSLVSGALSALAAVMVPSGGLASLALMAAWSGFAMAFVSGWPFLLAGDGYQAMCDAAGVRGLRLDAIRGVWAGSVSGLQALYVGGVIATWAGIFVVFVR